MKIRRLGLISRIALLVVCVEAVAFSMLGWFYTDRFSTAIEERTYSHLHLVGRMIANDELAISSISRQSVMTDLVGAPYLEGMVIGGNGRVIVSTNPAYLGSPARDIPGFDARWFADSAPDEKFIRGDNTLRAVMHIRGAAGGAPMYTTVIMISTSELDAMKRSIILRGQLGSLVFILLSSALIVLIAQHLITRRVNVSLEVLKKAEEGALDARIPVTSDDELGQLQHGINSMTAKVGTLLNQHRRNAEELREQKDLLASVIQHAPIRVFWKDRESRYIGCNSQFAQDAGLSGPEELVGKTDYDMGWRDQAEFYRADDRAVMESGISTLDFEETQTTPDGRTIWLSTSKVPLRGGDNRIIGVLGIYTDITNRKQAEEQIHNLAYFDPLTGLPNRTLLLDRLKHAMTAGIRHRVFGAVLLIDLDNFKTLNDTLGHDVGDQLLRQVAQRLTQVVREGDTVARLGGDEFVVILEGLGESAPEAAEKAGLVGEKILAAVNQPYQFGTHAHHSSPSIGVVLFDGNRHTMDDLLKQVDIAMYQAKKDGRNALRFFDPQMQESINVRMELESELHMALESGQLDLHYQAQVDNSGRPLGAEALIRWNHPERGLVSPAEFIPLAEETGLILSIGQWVLEAACSRIKAWESAEHTRGLVLSINVSAKQLHQADFVDQVRAAVQRHDIKPALLKLELTEGMLLENVEGTIATMNALNAIGVRISLDDFGTGYSSLQYLKRLPLDQLKIDRSFVRDIATDSSDKAIVTTIIVMARSLNLDVIAEGVETEEQRQFLFHAGCDHFQGYLFSRPVPIGQFESLLDQSRQSAPADI
ncbi:cyclic di-GMP phosphodiesterase Gmr [mine drainage metagenome]|uniref:Cyclic di-GMP phosphodiesterase Gmr n=1 Tax=mine drainage metagenome TaxID=410659 RepID=A0A1J5TCY9_9ZZZZ